MTVFAGHYGSIELKRLGADRVLDLQIRKSDVDFTRKRFAFSGKDGFDLPFGTITTGDRIRLTTADARGLPFRLFTNVANTQYIDNPGAGVLPIEFFANVDAMGAVRMYRNFSDAINNPGSRYLATPLEITGTPAPWNVSAKLIQGAFRQLAQVQGFTISTERETVDSTSIGDKFRDSLPSAINGSGSVDCLFSFKSVNAEEIPLALCELIQKIEVGSKFKGKFYLLEPGSPNPPGYSTFEGVWYEVDGIITRSGATVNADQIVECSFDFVSAGEFKLRSGDSPVDLTTEANVSMGNETDLESLGVLQESN